MNVSFWFLLDSFYSKLVSHCPVTLVGNKYDRNCSGLVLNSETARESIYKYTQNTREHDIVPDMTTVNK